MMNLNSFVNHEAYDLLIKAQKAASRYDSQLLRVVERKMGVNTHLCDTTLEEDVVTLKKRQEWAKHQILALNHEVRVLERYYDLNDPAECREMIYDFLDRVNELCYSVGNVVNK